MFKAAIFDGDGTPTDTKKAIMESFKEVLGEVGSIASDRVIERRVGTGTRKALEDALEASNVTFNDEMLKNFLGRTSGFKGHAHAYTNLSACFFSISKACLVRRDVC